MEWITSVEAMRELRARWRAAGESVALVPTMGAFHEGHLRLMDRARAEGRRVVVSLFVNPTQFGPNEDFERYPRDLEGDRKMAEARGVDAIFAPPVEEMYPHASFTSVAVAHLTRRWEGEARPGHFRGVCTVVLKLFNIVQPDCAVFGWKDAQQFVVLCHMVRDLNVPVRMIGAPTVREPDGLAMSSRNRYLSPEDREKALCLSRALRRVHFLVKRQGILHTGELLAAVRSTITSVEGVRLDYAAIVSRFTLEPIDLIESGGTLVLLAARVGPVRLIDNTRL